MVSSYKISHYLEGVDYPAVKQDLINQAKKNNAPDDVIDSLNHLPNANYDNMVDLWHGISQIE